MKSFKQHLSEQTAEEIIKMVPGGKDAEAVYETWVFIVARLSGSDTLPTAADIDKALSDSEINPVGKKWIKKLRDKIPDINARDRYVLDLAADMYEHWKTLQKPLKNNPNIT